MTAAAPPPFAAAARTAWTIGGGLLILSGLLAAIDEIAQSAPAVLGASALWAAALIIFAVGFRGSGRVTGRGPLGTVVFVLYAAWSILSGIQLAFFPFFGQHSDSAATVSLVTTLDYVVDGITLVLAILAALVVARSGAVTPRWNWAPLQVLTVFVFVELVEFVFLAAVHSYAIFTAVRPIDAIVIFAARAFLGVVAIALSNRGSLTPPAAPLRTE